MGEPDRPEVVQAMETVMARARKTNIAFGCGGASPEGMEYWINQGVHWILTSMDVSFMLKAAIETVERLRRIAPVNG